VTDREGVSRLSLSGDSSGMFFDVTNLTQVSRTNGFGQDGEDGNAG
jgi:hypothetical protein